MSRLILTLAVQLAQEQREYIGQLENSVPEFCVHSTGILGVVSKVTKDIVSKIFNFFSEAPSLMPLTM